MTVPGQAALAHRRKHLLLTADAVVFVADSSRARLRRTREGLELLRRLLDERGANRPPLVLQANKQDGADALTPEALLAALALSPSTPALPARAHQGVGVRETLIRTVRALTDHIQHLSDDVGLQLAVRPAESAGELHSAMIEDDFEEDIDLGVLSSELEDVGDAQTEPAAVVPIPAPPPPPPRPAPLPAPLAPPLAPRLPPLPRADARTGYVWPALTAREVLRDLEATEAAARSHSPDRSLPAVADGSGVACRVGGFWVRASNRRFAEPEEARTELIRLARARSLMGDQQLPGTVLAVQADGDRGWRLWTVRRMVATLESEIEQGLRLGDSAVARVLSHCARIAVDAILLASREHIVMSLSLADHALVNERTYYIGHEIGFGSTLPGLGEAIVEPMARAARFADACAAYVDRLETAMRTRLTPVDVERTGLARSLAEAEAAPPGRAALDRLLRSVAPDRPAPTSAMVAR